MLDVPLILGMRTYFKWYFRVGIMVAVETNKKLSRAESWKQ